MLGGHKTIPPGPGLRSMALLLTGLACIAMNAWAAEEEVMPANEAFGALKKEQSLAESYGAFFKELGKEDFERYGKGIRLYALAKAEFDGLIEQMKYDIVHGEPFEESEKFKVTLQTAVKHRLTFTGHVDETFEHLTARPGVADYIKSGAELVSTLTEAGISIWKEYWSIEESQRKETLSQLDSFKWKAFHELGTAG